MLSPEVIEALKHLREDPAAPGVLFLPGYLSAVAEADLAEVWEISELSWVEKVIYVYSTYDAHPRPRPPLHPVQKIIDAVGKDIRIPSKFGDQIVVITRIVFSEDNSFLDVEGWKLIDGQGAKSFSFRCALVAPPEIEVVSPR